MPASAPTERPASIAYDATRDPTAMTPEERRREVAAILARGVLRLRRSAENAPGSSPSRTPENTSKRGREALDEGARTSLHVFTSPASRQARETANEHMKGARKP
jgi:hypothetical protein